MLILTRSGRTPRLFWEKLCDEARYFRNSVSMLSESVAIPSSGVGDLLIGIVD
jgi:hypothetical protein